MSTGYIFNDRFSYRNLNSPTQWQRKSAGSFVPMLYYDYSKFENKFLGEKSVEHQINSRLALSYYYTLVLAEKWFATPNLSPSFGVRFSNYKDTDADGTKTTKKDTYFTRALEGGLQLGFNSPRIFAGANLNFNVNWYDEDTNSHVENDQVYGLLYVGCRFDAPGFVARTFKTAETKMQEKLKAMKKVEAEK